MSIIEKIKSLSNKVANWFTNLLAKNDSMVKVSAPIAVHVLNLIKNANASGVTDVLGLIVQSVGVKWGNSAASLVKKWISENIDKIISGVGIADAAAQSPDVNVKIKLVSQYIASLNVDIKGVKISELASMLAKDLDDSKLSIVEIVAIVTAIYKTE